MIRKFLSVALACALLTGCISAQSHPERWAQVDAARSDCAAIAGRYRNAGENGATSGQRRVWASQLLLQQPGQADIKFIEIAYDQDVLTIRGYQEETVVAEKTFSTAVGNLECGAGGVTINGQFGVKGPAENLLMVAVGGSSTVLHRLSDGALLIKSSGHAVGMVFFVPMVAGETELYRFAALD